MSKIKNQIILHNEYVEIKVTRTGYNSYESTVLIDAEDLPKVGKIRVTNANYVHQCNKQQLNVAHVVLNHISNMKTVVDHINGNRLDNRKANLRVVTQAQNANNRTTLPRNNTGIVGIQLRENGSYQYYRVTISDRHTIMGGTQSKTKQLSKQFNINKLGKEEAFKLAKNWLTVKKKEYGYI